MQNAFSTLSPSSPSWPLLDFWRLHYHRHWWIAYPHTCILAYSILIVIHTHKNINVAFCRGAIDWVSEHIQMRAYQEQSGFVCVLCVIKKMVGEHWHHIACSSMCFVSWLHFTVSHWKTMLLLHSIPFRSVLTYILTDFDCNLWAQHSLIKTNKLNGV